MVVVHLLRLEDFFEELIFSHFIGIMLHYDTPALSHLYFVDPQWLCDMLAHIVTVPEVNRFIQRTEGTFTKQIHVYDRLKAR